MREIGHKEGRREEHTQGRDSARQTWKVQQQTHAGSQDQRRTGCVCHLKGRGQLTCPSFSIPDCQYIIELSHGHLVGIAGDGLPPGIMSGCNLDHLCQRGDIGFPNKNLAAPRNFHNQVSILGLDHTAQIDQEALLLQISLIMTCFSKLERPNMRLMAPKPDPFPATCHFCHQPNGK